MGLPAPAKRPPAPSRHLLTGRDSREVVVTYPWGYPIGEGVFGPGM